MHKILSHGAWTRGPDFAHPAGHVFQTFAGPGDVDWYAYAHERLIAPDTIKILVRDGVVVMVERDGTRLVPPGEVFEAPASFIVERGWLWRGDRFEPPAAVVEDPASKLAAFLRDNPDVQAMVTGRV